MAGTSPARTGRSHRSHLSGKVAGDGANRLSPKHMSLIRSSLVVGLGSVASRILGFARDVLFAQALGAGPVADAFLAAFRLPNLVRRILGEGGLNPALVPALSRL